MTFAAVTKILKVCTAAVILKGCSSATRRKQCHGRVWYKDIRQQVVPVQVEGQTETDTQSFLKGNVLPYSGKKGECGTRSCKNDDRHLYDKRNTDIATKLNLP